MAAISKKRLFPRPNICISESANPDQPKRIPMSPKLYVSNLVFSATEGDLEELFSQFGTVTEARIVLDRETRRPRGFGFVTMSSEEEAQAAIDGLNAKEYQGRTLNVTEARPLPPREGGGGGNRGGRPPERREFGGGSGGGGGKKPAGKRGRDGGGGGRSSFDEEESRRRRESGGRGGRSPRKSWDQEDDFE